MKNQLFFKVKNFILKKLRRTLDRVYLILHSEILQMKIVEEEDILIMKQHQINLSLKLINM